MKLPNYQIIKSTWNIWYIDFEKENIVRGDPYKSEITKLPSYFVYMYFFVTDILKGGDAILPSQGFFHMLKLS